MDAVRTGSFFENKAAIIVYNVPRQTLRRYLSSDVTVAGELHRRKLGRKLKLGDQVEVLTQHIKETLAILVVNGHDSQLLKSRVSGKWSIYVAHSAPYNQLLQPACYDFAVVS